jgi:hypothetical protein
MPAIQPFDPQCLDRSFAALGGQRYHLFPPWPEARFAPSEGDALADLASLVSTASST